MEALAYLAAGALLGAGLTELGRGWWRARRRQRGQFVGFAELRAVLEGLPFPVALFDQQLRYLGCSARWRVDFGLGDQPLAGRGHYEVFPHIPERWRGLHRRALAGESLRAEEDAWELAPGKVQWLRWELRPWHTGGGRQGGIVMLCEDITARKEAELALQDNLARLETLVATLPEGVLVEDTANRVVLANPAFHQAFRIERGDLPPVVGRTCDELAALLRTKVAEGEVFCARAVQAAAGRAVVRAEAFRFADGRLGERDFFPIVGASGGIRGHLWRFRDVTDVVRARLALETAVQAAAAADRAKNEFLSNMSHEIRTPLNGVLGMLALLERTELDEAQREAVALTRRSADGLSTLLADIVEYASLAGGTVLVESRDFSLADLAEGVVEGCHHGLVERGLLAGVQVEDTVPAVLRGDPGRVRQLLTILVGNAVKFTRAGEVAVHARLHGFNDQRQTVVELSVRDTGPGMPPELVSRLFRPFVQGDGSSTRTHGGTGLGLAICQRVVNLLGGEIEIHSQPGRGTRVNLRLPFAAAAGFYFTSGGTQDLRGARVVVLDPNAWHRQLVSASLRGFGAEVVPVGHNAEALRQFLTTTCAVLVTRETSPGSWSALAAAAAGLSLPPTVLLTHRPQPAPAGAFRALPIPWRRDALHKAVRAALRATPPPPPPEPSPAPPRLAVVVDDSAINLRVAELFLRKLGWACQTAATAGEALELVRATAPAVVLLDLSMPEVDGFTLARQIRALPGALGRTRLVALTAHVAAEDRVAAMAAGMDDFLPKPLGFEALARVLPGPSASAA